MSNRVDFFQSEETKLAIPGANVSVLLDGQLCSCLELLEIVHGGWPEFSWARLAYNTAAYPQGQLKAPEEVENMVPIGKTICIRQVYNGTAPGAAAFTFPIFAGKIEGLETTLGQDNQKVEIIVKDFSAELKRITVYGRRVGNSDGSSLFLAGAETAFNDDGKTNAAIEPVEHNGKTYTVFCAEPSAGRFWDYTHVINYLLCEYLPDGQLQTPGIEQLRVLTQNQIARDLDVTGSNLLAALHRCCERVGLKFKFVPRLVSIGPEQAIVFYKNGTGRTVELNCQSHGEQFCISKTNISAVHSRKNFWPVTHKYTGQGDFRVYEATFDLVKAWDPADESTDYDTFSASGNPDFYRVKDVYRKWCLNEAGDYSDAPYNQGNAFDFSKIFGSGNFVSRRRCFVPALTRDRQGKSIGYFLQVSFDNGLNWRQYLYAFNNLLNECGVWLSSDQIDIDTWVASLKGTLKFRITASVVSDERLSCVVADGPMDSVIPVVEHIITLPRQFKYRKVSSHSIFTNSLDQGLGQPDETDDTNTLYEFVRKKAQESSEIIETANVQMPYVAFDYRIGDRITSDPQSRDLFSCHSDNRSICWIKRVQLDFERQCTNLKIIRQRKPQL